MPRDIEDIVNKLFYGDCLKVMEQFPDACVDLIYLDPPFNSNAKYNMIWGNQKDHTAQFQAFSDTWIWDESAQSRFETIKNSIGHPAHAYIVALHIILGDSGMMAYLIYLTDRLLQMRQVLKPTGSIFLHCDPTASHYLKMIMDQIFGSKNFRNEIIWGYTGPGSPNMRQFNRKHDVIFWYSKGEKWTFNGDDVRLPHADGGPHAGGFKGASKDPDDPEYGKKGKIPETWWTDIAIAPRSSKERLGYPTQKPIKLLKRIILAATNKRDIVLDTFCGCGTTIDAAMQLNRRWIGIDISAFAINVIRLQRFKDATMKTEGIPEDLASARQLAKDNPLQFEAWAVVQIPGLVPNQKKAGDGGIDGRGDLFTEVEGVGNGKRVLAQVKSGKFSLSQLRDFCHVIYRENAVAGVYITMDKIDTKEAKAEKEKMGILKQGITEYPRLQFWSIAEHFAEKQPDLPSLRDPYTGKQMEPGLWTKLKW